MNFLAHHWLAGADEQVQLGGWLGDFIKGKRLPETLPEKVRDGIRLHRRTDSWTDAHPLTLQLKSGFPHDYRRYAGIVLDLMTDHFLARFWQQFDDRDLEAVEQQAFRMLSRHRSLLPPRLQSFLVYAQPRKLLSGYRHQKVIMASLAGIGRRMQHPNPLADTRALIDQHYLVWQAALSKLLLEARALRLNLQ